MPRKKAKDTLDHLRPGECAQLLRELLRRHRDLRREAKEIAASLVEDVSVDAVAAEVTSLVGSIGLEELGGRAGKHSWGYVEPSEAAWELLEESIEDVRADVKRRFEIGMKPAAEKICQGIVLGLHVADGTNSDGALEWTPDLPAEAAAWSLSILLELYPSGQRRAAGERIIRGVEEHVEDWVEMLQRVVGEAATKKRRKRRQRSDG
jgi:mannose/cellobiose epimerase-like protein (N-acyl-D-glucosamine 2-epimerase family)